MSVFEGMYSIGLQGSNLGPNSGAQTRCVFAETIGARPENEKRMASPTIPLGDLIMVDVVNSETSRRDVGVHEGVL